MGGGTLGPEGGREADRMAHLDHGVAEKLMGGGALGPGGGRGAGGNWRIRTRGQQGLCELSCLTRRR